MLSPRADNKPNPSGAAQNGAAANGASHDGASHDGAAANGKAADGAVSQIVAKNAKPSREYSPKRSARDAKARVEAPARGPRRLLKIADNYIFWQMVAATLRGFIWFGGLLVLISSINVLKRGLQQGLPLDAMFLALLFQMPRVFLFSMPMSLLFGTVQTFSELSSRGEITALWAGGMGLKRMLRAPLLWGAILAVTSFGVQEFVVPGSELRSAQVFEERLKSSLSTQQNFRYLDPPLSGKGPLKLQILAERFDAKTNALINPHVTLYYEDGTLKLTIDAERGWADEKTSLWKFSNGVIRRYPPRMEKGSAAGTTKNQFNSGPQESDFVTIQNNLDGYGGVAAIRQAADLRARQLAKGSFEMVSIADLVAYRSELHEQGGSAPVEQTRRLISGATYGLHDKIATPLLCLALILVGAPLGIRPQRASAGFAQGLSFLVIGAYYILWTTASYGGKTGAFSPIPSAYIALFATAAIGAWLVWKKNR